MPGVWFEALPSDRRAHEGRIQADIDRLAALRGSRIERVLVPEVEDGDYQTLDPSEFAARAAAATGIPATVAVCAATRPAAPLTHRIQEVAGRHAATLLVGGPSSRTPTPGPTIEQALRGPACRHSAGVVTIAHRNRPGFPEWQRLLAKQRAGAEFAVSQIIFDADDAIALHRGLAAACRPGETPLPIYWSVAPVQHERDIRFLQRLGVQIPGPLLGRLREATDPAARLAASRDIAWETLRRIRTACAAEGLGAVGACVSHVMVHNVEPAIEWAKDLAAEWPRPVSSAA